MYRNRLAVYMEQFISISSFSL